MIPSTKCPICRQKFTEHSELQEHICKIIMVKEFSGNCPGFDVEHWGKNRQEM
jgi:hypothetical protein